MSNATTTIENDDFVMVERSDGGFLHHISTCVDALSKELREVSLEIHDNPELNYKEFHAHNLLAKYMEGKAGWRVTRSAYGIDTAFVSDSGEHGCRNTARYSWKLF